MKAIIPDLTVTVGQRDEQFVGTDHRPFQAAIRHLVEIAGGGTLKIGPGRFELRGAIQLADHIRIEGHGEDTVLAKSPSVRSPVVEDADWWDRSVLLQDASGFDPGCDIIIQGKDPRCERPICKCYTILQRDGNRLQLNEEFDESIWHEGEFSAATLHSIIRTEHVSGLEIRDLVIDGNRDQNENINGNYGAGIFMQRCSDVVIDNVTVREHNGDAFSMQVVHDFTIRNCCALNNADFGLHPGSGSKRPVLENNRVEGGSTGLFFCWGVRHGVVRGNTIEGSSTGISIGYKDSDNLVEHNRILGAGGVGLLFRDEKEEARSPNRSVFAGNEFTDCGPVEGGPVVHLQGPVDGTILRENRLSESRADAQSKTAILIEPGVGRVTLENNQLEGFALDVDDRRDRSQ
jgi:hypothetical protein